MSGDGTHGFSCVAALSGDGNTPAFSGVPTLFGDGTLGFSGVPTLSGDGTPGCSGVPTLSGDGAHYLQAVRRLSEDVAHALKALLLTKQKQTLSSEVPILGPLPR